MPAAGLGIGNLKWTSSSRQTVVDTDSGGQCSESGESRELPAASAGFIEEVTLNSALKDESMFA